MSSQIIFRDAGAPGSADSNLLFRWENTVNTPFVAVEYLDDGEAISDFYTVAATGGSAVDVTAEDTKNEVVGTSIAVTADGSTWNYGVVPGTRIKFSASLANGWTGVIGIGALVSSSGVLTGDRFNVGIVQAGTNSTQRRIAAVNVGSETSAESKVYSLPGLYLVDTAQPWITRLSQHTETARHASATPGTYVITYSDYQSGSPDTADVYVNKDGGGAVLAIEDAKLDGTELYQHGSGNGYSDANDALPGMAIILAANGNPTAQTHTCYVRAGYDQVEFAPDVTGSPGTWVAGPLDLTESGETTGTITASGTAYFWFRVDLAVSASPGDRRLFTLRGRGLTV
jgi:hypothetical protein